MITVELGRERGTVVENESFVGGHLAMIDLVDAMFESNEFFGVPLKEYQVTNLKQLRAEAIAAIEEYFV